MAGRNHETAVSAAAFTGDERRELRVFIFERRFRRWLLRRIRIWATWIAATVGAAATVLQFPEAVQSFLRFIGFGTGP